MAEEQDFTCHGGSGVGAAAKGGNLQAYFG